MGILYDEKQRVFKLDTPHTSYIMRVEDAFGYLLHCYYGPRLQSADAAYLTRTAEPPYTPARNARDKLSFLDSAPFEYPTGGVGDFREHCLELRTAAGHCALEAGCRRHSIQKGKKPLPGLPATFGGEADCTALTIVLADDVLGLEIELEYTVFEDLDAITRSVKVRNLGTKEKVLYLTKVLSACLDMDCRGFDMITLHGSWARERIIQRRPLGKGVQGVFSSRGETSHQEHPFLALVSPDATQTSGEVYAMHLVWSGNFEALAGVDQFDQVRAVIGQGDHTFCWKLTAGETFQAPEAVMVYSREGLGAMTRTFHDLYRNHLIRSPWRDKKRPILLNSWEGAYFDFDTDRLLDMARAGAALGMEMLVVDDGWFGDRFDDNRALGDWFVNEKKLPGGLKRLGDELNAMGMKLGLWMEPEMVSPDSDLYRSHPDWAIQVPGRTAGLCRNQYVLDLTRREVLEYVWSRIEAILTSANIEYVKWDMNRQLADMGSFGLDSGRQGELYYRYVLAVYELQERLCQKFPYILLENCSGGGARYDPGMLYYSPQIWCSDDTDAIERLAIQEGTALIYPLGTMGAHVSACPNHTVGRTTPFETRGHVALAGTFGYELDPTALTEEERSLIPGQAALYHRFNDLVREGDYYRLASWRENHAYDCWQVVSKDKTAALVTYVQVLAGANRHSRRVCLQGLDETARYRVEGTDQVYGGDTLMYGGLLLGPMPGDYKSKLIVLLKVEDICAQ